MGSVTPATLAVMGILQRILGIDQEPEPDTRSGPLYAATQWPLLWPSTLTPTTGDAYGAAVRSQPGLALAQPTVFASVRMVSAAVQSMPWRSVMRQTRQKATDQPAIIRQPDPFRPRENTLRQIATLLLMHGNCYLWLTAHDRTGRPTVAIPIPNEEVQVAWNEGQTRATYQWRNQPMTLGYDIAHLKYMDLGPGHLFGIGPIQAIASSIQGGLNADRLVATQFTEGAWVDGVLQAPNKLTATEAQRLREQWDSAHAGKRGTAVLEGGIEYKPVMMSNQEAELLGARKWYATDIVRAFGIPAPLAGLPMGEGSSLTYQNIEGVKSQFAQFAVQPVTDVIEAAFTQWVPSTQEVLFQFASLLRADIATRYSVYERALNAGILTPNEVRELEGLPDLPGGNTIRDSQPTPAAAETAPTPAQEAQVNA